MPQELALHSLRVLDIPAVVLLVLLRAVRVLVELAEPEGLGIRVVVLRVVEEPAPHSQLAEQ